MVVFDRYAEYYDLFYREKDYSGEVEYVEALIKKHGTGETKTILDLGCGTGGHAVLLAQKGYDVAGVDRSEAMLALAEEKKRRMKVAVDLHKGDICEADLYKRFDVAIAMFAVMGYQTTNADLERALRNAAKHLRRGGLLIFDGWFGPAVITQKPGDHELIVERGEDRIIRLTRAQLNIMTHTVDVDFTVMHIKHDKVLNSVEEKHKMRFFFPKELEFVLTHAGFALLGMHSFKQLEGELTINDWNMVVIARKT